jgi:hypothetical protein
MDSVIPIWQLMLGTAPLVIGLIAWLAVLGARVRALETEVKEISRLRDDMSALHNEMSGLRVDVRWIRERLAER